MKEVYLIGTGTDGAQTLTQEAAAVIARADLLIGAARMLEPHRHTGKTCVCTYQADEIAALLHTREFSCAAVLFSGDSGFFSGTKKLLPLLSDLEIRVLPGISSLAAFAAKCRISYENIKIISLHGADANIAVHVRTNEKCFFLLGGTHTAAEVCLRLCAYGLGGVSVHIGVMLGYPEERIFRGIAADLTEVAADPLAVMIVVNSSYLRHIPSAIPDGSFTRRQIPMTKAEVRCNAVAALRIGRDAVCWDIGSGTGSVSVEMAFRCPEGTVYAFDKNGDAAALTRENAQKFGCDNIQCTAGRCPEILQDAPPPDAVFIGGGGGSLREIFAAVYEKNPAAKIAVTAVSLETLSLASALFREYGGDFQTVQIAVTRTEARGAYTMLSAQNPVFLLTGGLQCTDS